MKKLIFIGILLFSRLFSSDLYCQETDSIPGYKNNIRLNISAVALYDQAFIPSYERILNKKQSFSIEAGLIGMQQFDTTYNTLIQIQNQKQKMAFKASADYRFYLVNENKYNIPRGLYLGPFLSYYHFSTKNDISYLDSTQTTVMGQIDGKLELFQAGFQLGYQFIFWDRMSVDLILLGPAVTYYDASLTLSGEIENKSEVLQDFLDKMIGLFPAASTLIETGTVSSNGRADFLAAGFRYSIHIGFLF